MKKTFVLLANLFLAGACSLQNSEMPEDVVPLADGQLIRTETVATLSSYGVRQPLGLLKFGDVVLISDMMNTDNIVSIHLADKQKEGLFPKVATRGGRASVLNCLAPDGQGGWTAFDFQTGTIKGVASPQIRSGGESSVQLPSDQKHLWAVQVGDKVLSTGLYTQGRYQLFSPASGDMDYGVAYPTHPVYPEIEERTKAVLFASNVLRARPDGGAFVCADMYSGVIDICQINGREISLVNRLVYHHPRVNIRERKNFPQVTYTKDNRFGFTDVCVTDDRIYALYSGKTYHTERNNFQDCHTLIEIAWDGTVRATYPIDVALTQIAFDEQEKKLYGIAKTPQAKLVRLNLPI